jgi:hypothetical protein
MSGSSRKWLWDKKQELVPQGGVESSPLLGNAVSRYRVQPDGPNSVGKNVKKKKTDWSNTWNEPANLTVKRTAPLAPPKSSSTSSGYHYQDNSYDREESGDSPSRRGGYGGIEDDDESPGGSNTNPLKSISLQRTAHAPTTELQLLDTRRTWLLLSLPAVLVVILCLFPPEWSIEINTVGLPFGPSPGRRRHLTESSSSFSSGGVSLSFLGSSNHATAVQGTGQGQGQSGGSDSGIAVKIEKSVQAMKYVQISVQLSEQADRSIPLSQLKKLQVEAEPYITCIADNDKEMGMQRVVSAITLDTSESFYFDYSNKSALVPSEIPLLYSSFTWGTIGAAPARVIRGSDRGSSEGGGLVAVPRDQSYYTFDTILRFRRRTDVDKEEGKKEDHRGDDDDHDSAAADGGDDSGKERGKEKGGRSSGGGGKRRALADSGGDANSQHSHEEVLSRVLSGSYLKIATQSLFFTLFDIFLRTGLCVATCYFYYIWWSRNWASLASSRRDTATAAGRDITLTSDLPDYSRDSESAGWVATRYRQLCNFNDALVTALATMLPEQLTSVWMLFFLLLWQSPMDVLLSASSLYGLASPPLHVHEAVFHTKYAAKGGFLYCMLVYIAGLKFYPGLAYHFYSGKGVGRGNNTEDVLDFDGVIGGGSTSEHGAGAEGHYVNRGAGHTERVDQSPRRGFGLWSWLSDTATDGTGNEYSSPIGRGGMDHNSHNMTNVWQAPKQAVRRLYRGALSRQSLVAVISGGNKGIGGEGLLEADTSADHPSFGLPVHHCLSSEYLDFVWNKLLMLFVGWAVQAACGMYLRDSRLAIEAAEGCSASSCDGESEFLYARYVGWHNLLQVSLLVTSVLWTVFIFYSGKITNWHLRAVNYSLSRHRHLSFRLFVTQVYIWGAVVVTIGLYRYNECMEVLHRSFNFIRDSTMLQLLFSKPPHGDFYSFALWEERQKQLMTFLASEYLPPFGFFTYIDLVTFSALAYGVVYAYLPPQTDNWQAYFDKHNAAVASPNDSLPQGGGGLATPSPNHRTRKKTAANASSSYSDSYVPLERDIPRHVRSPSNRPQKLFCLETACRLLEVSEQSYYRPTLLHLEAIGAYPATATDKALLARELRDRVVRESSRDALKDLDQLTPDRNERRGRGGEGEDDKKKKTSTKTVKEESNVVMNPFDEGYDPRAAEAALSKVAEEGWQDGEGDGEKEKEDDGMNSLSTYAMNLEPLGLQMLSMFSGDAYYGFVARSLPLPGGADNPQSNLSLGGGPAASGSSRGAHTARLAPLSCSASQNKLTICFRGTADLGTLVADFKAFPSAMIDVSEDSAFFRELLMRRQDGYGDGDRDNDSNDGSGDDIGAVGADDESKGAWSALSLIPPTDDDDDNTVPFSKVGSPGGNEVHGGGGDDQPIDAAAVEQPYMHVGFKEAYLAIRMEALSSVVSAMYMLRKARDTLEQQQRAPRREEPLRLDFCGHSLGGVLALLLAYDVSVNTEQMLQAVSDALTEDRADEAVKDANSPAVAMPDSGNVDTSFTGGTDSTKLPFWPHVDCSVYTYGSPRVGNKAFIRKLASRVHVCYRVELDGDMVTSVPPHMAQAGDQVLVDPYGAGNLIVNPSVVESHLLANHHSSVTKHTIDRYRSCLERCFTREDYELYVNSSYTHVERLTAVEKALMERGLGQASNRAPSEVPNWMF